MAVTSADIATTLGRPAPETDSALDKQWTLWIGDARRLIENRLGDLSALDQDDLDYVVREAVAERVRNGGNADGSTSETVSVDDGSVTKRWEQGVRTQIEILDQWWALLTPDADAGGAWTIRPYAVRTWCP